MSSSARRTVFLGADFVQYDAESGVRFPPRLVSRRTPAPGSGSCGGAGAGAHRALPTLAHHAFITTLYRLRLPARPSHAMLPPRLSPSTNPAPSRPESSSRRAHHPFLIAPLTLVLMLVRPSRGPCYWKRYPLSLIFHVPQPSRQPLIPPAYVVHARASLRPSVARRSISRGQRTRAHRLHGAAAKRGRRARREEGRWGRDG
jgi:hypothetical protein